MINVFMMAGLMALHCGPREASKCLRIWGLQCVPRGQDQGHSEATVEGTQPTLLSLPALHRASFSIFQHSAFNYLSLYNICAVAAKPGDLSSELFRSAKLFTHGKSSFESSHRQLVHA